MATGACVGGCVGGRLAMAGACGGGFGVGRVGGVVLCVGYGCALVRGASGVFGGGFGVGLGLVSLTLGGSSVARCCAGVVRCVVPCCGLTGFAGCAWCIGEFGGEVGLGGVQVGQNNGRMCPCGQVVGGGLVGAVATSAVGCRRGTLCGVESSVVVLRVRFVVGCC